MRTAIAIFAAFTLSTTASAQSTDDTAWVHDTAQAPSANLTKPTTTTGEGAFAEMLATRAPSRQNAVAQAEARLASALSTAIQRADAATLQALGWFGRCCTHAVLQGHVTDGATLAGTVVCGGIALLLCFVCACWGNKQHQHHAGVNRCRNDSILDGDRAR